MKEKVFFKTFGCRTNIYDTELLKSYVKDYEIINDENKAQIIVVNSCTVTNGADSGIKSYVNTMQKKGIKVIYVLSEEKQDNKDSENELKRENQEIKLDFTSIDILVKHLQQENKDLKSQINTMLELQNKQLDQIQHLYNQIDDKDKLITELSRRISEQTRLPVLVQEQKQTLWQKIKWTFFSK